MKSPLSRGTVPWSTNPLNPHPTPSPSPNHKPRTPKERCRKTPRPLKNTRQGSALSSGVLPWKINRDITVNAVPGANPRPEPRRNVPGSSSAFLNIPGSLPSVALPRKRNQPTVELPISRVTVPYGLPYDIYVVMPEIVTEGSPEKQQQYLVVQSKPGPLYLLDQAQESTTDCFRGRFRCQLFALRSMLL